MNILNSSIEFLKGIGPTRFRLMQDELKKVELDSDPNGGLEIKQNEDGSFILAFSDKCIIVTKPLLKFQIRLGDSIIILPIVNVTKHKNRFEYDDT